MRFHVCERSISKRVSKKVIINAAMVKDINVVGLNIRFFNAFSLKDLFKSGSSLLDQSEFVPVFPGVEGILTVFRQPSSGLLGAYRR